MYVQSGEFAPTHRVVVPVGKETLPSSENRQNSRSPCSRCKLTRGSTTVDIPDLSYATKFAAEDGITLSQLENDDVPISDQIVWK